jgi:hypothetical protein
MDVLQRLGLLAGQLGRRPGLAPLSTTISVSPIRRYRHSSGALINLLALPPSQTALGIARYASPRSSTHYLIAALGEPFFSSHYLRLGATINFLHIRQRRALWSALPI